MPWRRAQQPTPVSLPGESHGQRNLAGYSLWGHKESDTAEHAHSHAPGRVLGYTSGSLLQFTSVAQSCPALCDPMGCSPPGSSVLGILQARLLEWVAVPSSSRSSQPWNQTHISSVSCIGRRHFTTSSHLESLSCLKKHPCHNCIIVPREQIWC